MVALGALGKASALLSLGHKLSIALFGTCNLEKNTILPPAIVNLFFINFQPFETDHGKKLEKTGLSDWFPCKFHNPTQSVNPFFLRHFLAIPSRGAAFKG
jgi:hypothetical protein